MTGELESSGISDKDRKTHFSRWFCRYKQELFTARLSVCRGWYGLFTPGAEMRHGAGERNFTSAVEPSRVKCVLYFAAIFSHMRFVWSKTSRKNAGDIFEEN